MRLCGIEINCLSFENLLGTISQSSIVVTVNAEAIVRSQKDERLRSIINNNTTTIDGQIPLWLFKRVYPGVEIEKISGSDLIYTLPEYASLNGLKVYLLGGQSKSNSEAVVKLKSKYSGLEITGFSPPYSPYPFTEEINSSILDSIKEFSPDILFVGFGMGKQEFWAQDNFDYLSKIGVKLIIGCGGSFEFASGRIKRAPVIFQNMGLEGLWRLVHEFKWFRIRRILLSSKIFYYYVKHHG